MLIPKNAFISYFNKKENPLIFSHSQLPMLHGWNRLKTHYYLNDFMILPKICPTDMDKCDQNSGIC